MSIASAARKGRLASDLKLVKRLGQGSFGTVSKTTGVQQGDGPAVVKFVDFSRFNGDKERGIEIASHEAKALAIAHDGTVHRNINRLLDIVETKGQLYILSPYCDTPVKKWAKATSRPAASTRRRPRRSWKGCWMDSPASTSGTWSTSTRRTKTSCSTRASR